MTTAATFRIVCNRAEGDMAISDDLVYASRIVAALMEARSPAMKDERFGPAWLDYWIIDQAGNEYYYDAELGSCFSAACFVEAA